MDLMCCVELVGGSTGACPPVSWVGVLFTVFVLVMVFLHMQGFSSALDISESILVTVKCDMCVQQGRLRPG